MRDREQILEEVINIGNKMTQINNTDILMETILSEARKFVNADAGSFYICEDDQLLFSYTQNDTFQRDLPPGKKLVYSTFRMPISEASISGYVAISGQILKIDDVYDLDPAAPYKFNKAFDDKTGYYTVSMLTIPLVTPAKKVIGILQLINAKDEDAYIIPFSDEDIPFIKHFANNAAVALQRADMTRDLILRMIKMAEMRDPKETGAHVNRVAAYSSELYERWAVKHNIPEQEWHHQKDLLRMSAMLHDVGKVGISDNILKKAGKLTDEEFADMKKHPMIGARLFANEQSELDMMSRDIAFCHHERWDGRGYPGYINIETEQPLEGFINDNGRAKGKTGEEIPLMARIVAIADVFDALSCRRCYKEAWSFDEVWEELARCAGSQFDPELIEIFLDIREVIVSIKSKYPDEE